MKSNLLTVLSKGNSERLRSWRLKQYHKKNKHRLFGPEQAQKMLEHTKSGGLARDRLVYLGN